MPKTRLQLARESQRRRNAFLRDMSLLARQHQLNDEELAYALVTVVAGLQYRLLAEIWRNDAGEADQ